MASSATLFNEAIYKLLRESPWKKLLAYILNELLGPAREVAPYPNTFNGMNPNEFPSWNESSLSLVDGGEDNENLPLWPLLQPERAVDVVLAFDGSDDAANYPDGTSLLATALRIADPQLNPNNITYPALPSDTHAFVADGCNTRTTFFGCEDAPGVPLIIYIPNYGYTSNTGYSTFKLSYNDSDVNSFLANGMVEATGGPGKNLAACLACALTFRGLQRLGKAQTAQCADCFTEYCWSPNSSPSAVLVDQASFFAS